ncbi:type II toxin-antitoxin system HipA family toxin [Ideonella sp.]|jgi:serine/threonine-protein kinase HipA|uniref:type II toxin-antitoxin system HipA family toxin n=1 Tax=Ideonella sp. TaxID=1929293 RepID=UPI0037C145E8
MSSYQVRDELYLWWLAQPERPVLVGTLRHVTRHARQAGGVSLEYDPGWIANGLALSEDLPLKAGAYLPTEAGSAVGAVDDARPDRWGERVIRLLDHPARLSTLEFLYFAGDDRFGALGVSTSAATYEPRRHGPMASLDEIGLIEALVRQVEAGEPVEERLRRLITPGATLGGARPKALAQIDGECWVVKFSEQGDTLDSPAVEHATMTLARQAGIEVCETRLIALARGHAVAVRRFDRQAGCRLHAVSAHVALRAAGQPMGYPELALLLRRKALADRFEAEGAELFRRMVFNILMDNTDDHEKNHALLVDAQQYFRLAPAFDVLPAGQALGYQQMRVGRAGAESTLSNALSEHRSFALTLQQATAIAAEVAGVVDGWQAHFERCGVSPHDCRLLAQEVDRPFLLAQRRF